MKRVMIMAAVVGLITGCGVKNDQKARSYERWSQARAGVMCGLAQEHLRVGDLKKARTTALEALQLDQSSLPARILLAKALIEEGHYARAVEELRIGEVLADDNPQVAHLLGVALEKRGEHLEALKYYQRARALDPSEDAYVAASAEVLVAMGKPAEGLDLLSTRLERRDVSLPLHALAGELAMLVGQPERAIGFYQHCLDADPKGPVGREGLAKAYFFAGRHDRALKRLEGLASAPAYQGKTLWVYLMIGDSQMALDRPRKARDAYEAAAGIEPGSARVWGALARAALALGDLTGASAAARRVLALGGDPLEPAIVLACGLLRSGRPADALRLLKEASSKHPQDTTVLCLRGRCHQQMGQDDQAADCYRRVLRSDPEHRLAKALLGATGRKQEKIR